MQDVILTAEGFDYTLGPLAVTFALTAGGYVYVNHPGVKLLRTRILFGLTACFILPSVQS